MGISRSSGNKGYRRFLKSQGAHFAIDEAKVEDDARYDGLWVLQTDTEFEPMEVALAYKHLWMVEALFRSMKSVLDTRPVYHQTDRCIRGHVFCSFLALVLRQELQRRLAAKRWIARVGRRRPMISINCTRRRSRSRISSTSCAARPKGRSPRCFRRAAWPSRRRSATSEQASRGIQEAGSA